MSGPLLDRIDLRVVMPRTSADQLVSDAGPESSATVAARVAGAWELARLRNRGQPNAALRGRHLLRACALDASGRLVLRDLASRLELTARGVHRMLRVARTIADLREHETVGAEEIYAATSMRDRSMEGELAA